MKTFLTVGTKDIYEDYFCPIEDSLSSMNIKPAGGLWATIYEPGTNYNHWVEFLLKNIYLLFYKNYGTSPYQKPCSVLYIKENANIFTLSDKSSLDYLIKLFPSNNNLFSFEAMSLFFDGIYVDYNKIVSDNDIEKDIKEKFHTFGVETLLLFNTKAISYYKSAELEIEPFDFEEFQEVINYKINVDNKEKRVNPSSINYKLLIDNIYNSLLKYFKKENIHYSEVDKSLLIKLINNSLEEFKGITEIKNNPNIERQLLRKITKVDCEQK